MSLIQHAIERRFAEKQYRARAREAARKRASKGIVLTGEKKSTAVHKGECGSNEQPLLPGMGTTGNDFQEFFARMYKFLDSE